MNNDPRPTCNCREKIDCPVEGKCQHKNVIFSVTVTHTSNNIKEYVRFTSRMFKKRLYEHKYFFPGKTRQSEPKN